MAEQPKVDPITSRYYRPLTRADRAGALTFYASAVISLAIPLIDRASHPVVYQVAEAVFIVLVIALVVVGLTARLYLFPRAQEQRYRDFLGHVYRVPLTHEATSGYYNVVAPDSARQIAGQVMENTFYSKDTAQKMAVKERIVIATYLVLWLVAMIVRNTGLETIGIAAQILFSEQIISHWLRLEWFRSRCEQIFHELELLFQTDGSLQVASIELLGRYEISKAASGIVLSESVFLAGKSEMDQEWQRIRSIYGL